MPVTVAAPVLCSCDDIGVQTDSTPTVVLRTIRYGEADAILSLYTLDRGRASAIAKGARRATSKLGGRLQPGVVVDMQLHRGRGELLTVRGAVMLRANAGLWVEGYRLRAAGCVLETAMRTLPEDEANPEAHALLVNTLALLAGSPVREGHPRLDPVVLGFAVKLLVVSGLLPRLANCANCGAAGRLVGFSAHAGGALCDACARAGEPVDDGVLEAFAGVVGRPLAESADACPPHLALGVERLVGLVLHEHLGVELRSATPVRGW